MIVLRIYSAQLNFALPSLSGSFIRRLKVLEFIFMYDINPLFDASMRSFRISSRITE